jgi:hypothetical protein
MEEWQAGMKVFSPKVKADPAHGNGEIRFIEAGKRCSLRVAFDNGHWKAFSGKNLRIEDILCQGRLVNDRK